MGPRRSGQSLYRKPMGISNPGMAQVVGDPPSNHSSSNSIHSSSNSKHTKLLVIHIVSMINNQMLITFAGI